MPRTGANIYKRKDGRWEGRYIKGYTQEGKAKYGYVYSKTYSDVRLKLNLIKSDILNDCSRDAHINITFAELSEKWIYSSKNRVKPSTLSTYANMLERYILPSIGGYKLKCLSTRMVQRFADDKLSSGRADGRGLSAKTVRDILSLVKSILEYAQSENYIPKGSITIKYPKSTQRKIRVLSREEQAKLETALLNNTDIYKFGVLVCLYTGLRIGEICALKWSDISLTSGVISVSRTIQRINNLNKSEDDEKTKIIIDKPKSSSSERDIPIPHFLADGFERFFVDNKNAFFLTGSKTRFIEPRTYQNYFKRYIEESGIEDANFHSLRHTFSTRCVEFEVDIKSLSEILGHSNVTITLNRYVHSSFELKKKNIMKLSLISV